MSNQFKEALRKNKAAPLKRLGQNFLVSQEVKTKIIEAAQIKPKDTVLEIGPGLGALTFELAQKAKQVIAIEKDKKIAEILKKRILKENIRNIKVIAEDILKDNVLLSTFNGLRYKVVANLPFNIATAVIMKFLESKKPPKLMVVMVQKEVAQRMCASPPHMNKLAVFCQALSKPEIVAFVSSSAFWPKPKVNSAIIRLQPKETNGALGSVDYINFSKVVNAGFSHPRKTLLNNFAKLDRGQTPISTQKEKIAKWLVQNNIQPNQRPETLTINDWQNLVKTLPPRN